MIGPNIIWIVLDTARADALEPYGAPAGASPAIADLAARGLALQDARVTASWTLPSHASMFTGALPRGLGLGQAPSTTPQSVRPVMRAERERVLTEVIRRAGYATAAVSTNPWVSSWSGFETGFDRFVELTTSRQGRLDGGRRARAIWALEAMWGRADDGAGEAWRILSGWIDELEARPFFWFVNLVECHSPYLPPRPYHAISIMERVRAAEEARSHLNLKAIWRACTGEFDVPEEALDRMRRLYAGSVRYSDDWLAMLLAKLERSGVLGDTLMIVCSDHGENFGEGDLLAHAFSLDDRLIRVPFIAAGPGAEEFAGMKSLAEFPARIASSIGLDDHPWGDGALPAGLSVAQWDPPAPPSDPRVRELVAEWGLGEDTAQRLGTELTCAVKGRWKLVRRGNNEELFDLESDPLELHARPVEDSMTIQPGDALESLRAALNHPAAMATVQHEAQESSVDELEEIEDRMRLLGYM